MRRAKRMTMIVMAAALVTTLLASSFPAGAQADCPEGSIAFIVFGEEGFVCFDNNEFFCPEGFVEGAAPENSGLPFFCFPAPPDGGGDGGGGGGGGGGGAAPLELTQETEQEAESGDVDQSFEVTGGGDNSNQCAGVQGVANTGNPQNVTDLLQALSEADDFEFEEVGSDITVGPESPTTCDQQVNQAASASG